MTYLRSVAPEETQGKSDLELSRDLDVYDDAAARFGLRTERSRAQWAYLMLSTAGSIEHAPSIRRFLTTEPGEPHEKMQVMMDQMVRLPQLDQGRS
ncbi:hypothetical protein [Lichenibacterium ramalinae]|uniref:hypothetical protein n=1 Tax=Lichenibacterium ramalinae TaxID=2316527 RepID=UPI00100E39F9|nr:hypothetical protein [Lichenibacterium ramalinae]